MPVNIILTTVIFIVPTSNVPSTARVYWYYYEEFKYGKSGHSHHVLKTWFIMKVTHPNKTVSHAIALPSSSLVGEAPSLHVFCEISL